MKQHTNYILLTLCLLTSLCITGCAIPDDIPYPTVESDITAFEVEGQCDESGTGQADAIIDKAHRSVRLFVDDLVDVTNLKVKRIETSYGAAVIIDSLVRVTSDTYHVNGYPVGSEKAPFYINAQYPVPVTLHTYQDYEWTLHVTQVIKREIEVEGQVGNAVIDAASRVAIIYVNQTQDLSQIRVKKFTLGGQHGTVMEDPTGEEPVDFSYARRFYVKYGWSDLIYMWKVYVYQTTEAVAGTAAVTTNAKGATVISGSRPNGVQPIVEYRAESDATWTTVPAAEVNYPSATTYEVVLKSLHTDVNYVCHVKFGSEQSTEMPFTFTGEQLENSSFSDWHIQGEGARALYLPWAEGGESYWDTGNQGATTVGSSNSTYVDEDGRRYANLQSKYIVIKFAAGSIFTGSYIETDGTNGVLSFGRPFTSRPAQLQFDFQYQTSEITRNGGEWKDVWGQYITRSMYEGLKGKPDSCNLYIALGDWEPVTYKGTSCPYLIRTRPSALHLMDMNDSHLIGFAQMTCGDNVNTWTTKALDIKYRNDRTPKYIIVVASSSKYGDYFTGGETSLMKVDNLKLIY